MDPAEAERQREEPVFKLWVDGEPAYSIYRSLAAARGQRTQMLKAPWNAGKKIEIIAYYPNPADSPIS